MTNLSAIDLISIVAAGNFISIAAAYFIYDFHRSYKNRTLTMKHAIVSVVFIGLFGLFPIYNAIIIARAG